MELNNKFNAYSTKCSGIILRIDQKSDHVTNEDLYKKVKQIPINMTINDQYANINKLYINEI